MASVLQEPRVMPRSSRYRLCLSPPLLALLLLLAACSSTPDGATSRSDASASAKVGEIGGEVTSTGPLTGPGPGESTGSESTPVPTPEPTATPPPTPPPQEDGFTAAVHACRSISGSSCTGEYGTMPAETASFTALVTFTDANAGDTINVVLTGPSGTFAGGPYTLGGGGDGYYYSNFSVPNLAAGTYTLTASRNGSDVATTTFTKEG